MKCPHCLSEFEVQLGGLSLLSGSGSNSSNGSTEEKETPKKPVRGKAREYSQAFEMAWKAYGRKEQKFEAFGVWIIRAREEGETKLLTLILGALKWQGQIWGADGWQFAPYFERYLKRRKWEDERPPAAPPPPQVASFAKRVEDDAQARARAARAKSAFGGGRGY